MVSNSAHEELRSHHSIPNSKNLNKLKPQQLFLGPTEEQHHKQIAIPQFGKKHRQIQRITLSEQNLGAETSVGNSAR